MSSSPYFQHGRPKNTDPSYVYIQDDENTTMWDLNGFNGNKFFGTWSKAFTIDHMLFREQKDKYTNKYAARLKAERELNALPICFEKCVNDFESGLSGYEKNCLRECTLKRISSIDDLHMMLQQKLAYESIRATKERAAV